MEGRPLLNNIITKIYDLMTINWKVWAPIGIVVIAMLIIIGSYQSGTKTPAPITGKTPQAPIAEEKRNEDRVTVKPATGNVDDTVNAILVGISDDEALFANAQKDAELIAADSQTISDFGQSYNENEF